MELKAVLKKSFVFTIIEFVNTWQMGKLGKLTGSSTEKDLLVSMDEIA